LSPVIFTTTNKEVPFPEVAPAETYLSWKSEPDLAVPDTQPIHFSFPLYDPEWMQGPRNGFTLMGGLIRPMSRGSITLSGAAPEDPILIDLGALQEAQDVKVLAASVRQCRDIGRAPALQEWGPLELYPGPDVADDALEDYVRRTASTYHHQVGTCRMGTDAGAVVDPRTLKVHGLGGIRIADASVMPLIPSGNTNALTIMSGERAAEFITGISPVAVATDAAVDALEPAAGDA
jgi:choline dehydrogenase